MSITWSWITCSANGLFGDTLNLEKSLPFKIEDLAGSSKARLLSFSVNTSLISSSGKEEICAMQSSVAENNFKISS